MTDTHQETLTPCRTLETVQIRAQNSATRRLGRWTRARRFDVRAYRSSILLELRSPEIEAGDIEIALDIDHCMVKLLVPGGAIVDRDDLRHVGRCGYVDWGGATSAGERRIRVVGEMRQSEIRVNRGGIAILAAMMTREYRDDLRRAFRENHVTSLKDMEQAYREKRWTTIEDPGRLA